MSVDAETYIVISLMFAVFAAVAAVGTSVVLGAGFERLRAGFEVVRRQSGFFADAIYKLDQRTQKLDEDAAKLKGTVYSMSDRVERVEKTTSFLADEINSMEQRILQGTPVQPEQPILRQPIRMSAVHIPTAEPRQQGWIIPPPAIEQTIQPSLASDLFRDYPEEAPASSDHGNLMAEEMIGEPQDTPEGFTTLLSRYFTGESSGGSKGVVYH